MHFKYCIPAVNTRFVESGLHCECLTASACNGYRTDIVLYTFADIEFDTATHELRREGVVQHVEPLVLDMLKVLLEHRHRVISKDQLMSEVWQGRIVSDSTIAGAIKVARQAIGDDGKKQCLIRTFNRRGYRFVGEVNTQSESLDEDSPALTLPTRPAASTTDEKKDSISSGSSSVDYPSIAVLPFEMRAEFSRFPLLAEAIAHDISRGLSRLRWLRVIATASAFRFRGAELAVEKASYALGARYYLSGSLEMRGSTLLLAVELVDSRDMKVLWSEAFEGSLNDIDTWRAEVTGQAIAMVEQQVPLGEANLARLRSPDELDAWAAFYLGLVNVNRFTPESTLVAINLFQRAIMLEPGLARAHAALSFAYFQQAFNHYPGVDVQHAGKSTAACADRSMELDEFDPFCNFVRGRVSWLSGEVDQSFTWLDRANQINPNFAQGFYARALAAVLTGMPYDVHGASERACALSPLDPMKYGFYGIRAFEFLAEKDYESARIWADKSANEPNSLVVMDLVAVAANQLAGDTIAARRWAKRAQSRRPDIGQDLFFRALPFHHGELRNIMSGALKIHGF